MQCMGTLKGTVAARLRRQPTTFLLSSLSDPCAAVCPKKHLDRVFNCNLGVSGGVDAYAGPDEIAGCKDLNFF